MYPIKQYKWKILSVYQYDIYDDNIDIYIEYDGIRYVGTVFTYKNIKTIMDKCKHTSENSGDYFWATGMIIVDLLVSESIENAIDDLIKFDALHKLLELVEQD